MGGLAKEVREIDVATGAVRVLGKSGDAVRCLEWGQDSGKSLGGFGFSSPISRARRCSTGKATDSPQLQTS